MDKPPSPLGTLGNLALELRHQIYKEVIADGFIVGSEDDIGKLYRSRQELGILQVSRAVYLEVKKVLDRDARVHFQVVYGDGFFGHGIEELDRLEALRQRNLSATQHVMFDLYVDWKDVDAIIEDYIARGVLKQCPPHGIAGEHSPPSEGTWVKSWQKLFDQLTNLKTCELAIILNPVTDEYFQPLNVLELPLKEMCWSFRDLEQVTITVASCDWDYPDQSRATTERMEPSLHQSMLYLRRAFKSYLGPCGRTEYFDWCESTSVEDFSEGDFTQSATLTFHPRSAVFESDAVDPIMEDRYLQMLLDQTQQIYFR
ncbi:uncharacterized protein KY384_002954 [Bacidia gigantensis]|uniref:uncharacterized protein n=1 Tax=Bacidia gigantensis TaxID=2732470 RepID=UPI001D042025|nr:uncharacterized protein KY384_002954 [Bacidia gigantensis]KAG8531325.1 hypothetical protein KY384_002954 [Bacidia gigantensis]